MDNISNDDHAALDRLIPVTKWPKYHPWSPIGGLRHLIFNEHRDGFSHCVVRTGCRVLISVKRFFEWANGQERKFD